MRKFFTFAAGALCVLTACSNEEFANNEDACTKQTVRFLVTGDFGSASFLYGDETRGSVMADGKSMTDIWVLDYDEDGTLVQQLHQTSADEDFGNPAVELEYGEHTLYFVAARGEGAVLSTDAHKITWTKPLDTFWCQLPVTVTSGSASAQTVNLSRVATKLTINVTDVMPEACKAVDIKPQTWYHGLDYLTGGPAEPLTATPRTVNIPASYIGGTNTPIHIYGMSTKTEWTTSIGIVARNADGDVIGQGSIASAPFKANRVTMFSGNLFEQVNGFQLALVGEWEDAYNGEW